MTRFIMLSFAFLGWGYYELSGGADFEPGWHRGDDSRAMATLGAQGDIAAEAPAPEVSRAAQGGTDLMRLSGDTGATSIRNGPEAVVQRVSLSTPSAPADQAATGAVRIDDVWLTRREAVAVAAPAPAYGASPGAEAGPKPDMRAVAGSRVNLRNGPGTRHSVVAKLDRGTPVEVLRTEGAWVKLRVVESRRIGWMAEYLVTAAAD
ncbi:SH3 domain-containing protein [Roseivivax lentus]|uniref:SH3 domain-containing protein n=1 Tax=Roseivivax lentus TaxID=633194 RepID=A0A1N7M619_9RHOB|nr:SH3 domain-containing protein [Roseivivax lentus]SIS81473.1 SH3 domain-containing protein [Roseivivax lentus]